MSGFSVCRQSHLSSFSGGSKLSGWLERRIEQFTVFDLNCKKLWNYSHGADYCAVHCVFCIAGLPGSCYQIASRPAIFFQVWQIQKCLPIPKCDAQGNIIRTIHIILHSFFPWFTHTNMLVKPFLEAQSTQPFLTVGDRKPCQAAFFKSAWKRKGLSTFHCFLWSSFSHAWYNQHALLIKFERYLQHYSIYLHPYKQYINNIQFIIHRHTW